MWLVKPSAQGAGILEHPQSAWNEEKQGMRGQERKNGDEIQFHLSPGESYGTSQALIRAHDFSTGCWACKLLGAGPQFSKRSIFSQPPVCGQAHCSQIPPKIAFLFHT